jgi:hypothetical protein
MTANERSSRVAQVAEARRALNPRICDGPRGTRRKDWWKGGQGVSRLDPRAVSLRRRSQQSRPTVDNTDSQRGWG